jgi:23S rRNA pseudouridine1911/1915/1917 synthase
LPTDLLPQDIPVGIVYQDDDIVVVDKPAGLSVHPGPGHPDGTLVNALLARCPDIRGVGGELRPGIVHRLDRDTSGLLVVAKSQLAHQRLTEQMKLRAITKEYQAVAVGMVTPDTGTIDAPIARHPYHRQRMAVVEDGRAARTHYRTAENLNGHTLLTVSLETGRTHQIRVHLAHIGFPVLGDQVYGRASQILDRQFLHAARLGFHHPITGEWSEHESPLPPKLARTLRELRNSPGSVASNATI